MKAPGLRLWPAALLWALFLFSLITERPPAALAVSGAFAAAGSVLYLHPKLSLRQQNSQNQAERILRRTFGRFTPLAMYGSIAVLAVLGIASRLSQNRILVRIFLLYLVFFLIFGLYLCYLVSVGKNEEQHNRENKGGDP